MEARPRRGTIYDRTGRALAVSAWKHRLLFNPSLYDPAPIEAAFRARGDASPTASEKRRMDRLLKVRTDIEYALPKFLAAEKIRFEARKN
jgi:cell division protein FtsI/penicillin-binding protein 2